MRRFQHAAGGVDWYCEQRGDGPPVVLVPSGEGDCASFDAVASLLAKDFSVLTFDTPGFSRSAVRHDDHIAVSRLADQIACLVDSLEFGPASFYGCSSGGFAALDLTIRHDDLVRTAIVHEVALPDAAALLADLTTLDDAAVVETCRYMFANVMNDDAEAWEALGSEFHDRLARNYVTWVRRYVAPPPPAAPAPADLTGKPIVWTVGGLTPAVAFLDNVVLAVRSGLPIGTLMCKHFPQVSAPQMLAAHIRTSAIAG